MKLTAMCALVASVQSVELFNAFNDQKLIRATHHHDAQPKIYKEACSGYDKSGDLADSVFMRKIYYTIWNSIVKGWYHSQRKNTVSTECLGDWMDASMKNADDLLELVAENKFFEISAPKVKQVVDDGVDFFFKNAEKCGVYRFTSDQFTWCSDNVGTCMFQEDFMTRLVDNATPLMSKVLDLGTIIMGDESTCLNDTQNLELIDRIITDFASIASSFIGFQGTWGQSDLGTDTLDDM